MALFTIKINGVSYDCVGTLIPSIETEYVYDEITLDGNRHRKFKGKKTNYSLVFFNDLSGSFYELADILSGNNIVELTVPTGRGEKTASYYPEISEYIPKGYLYNGVFYETGLKVLFDKVGYDE